MPLHVKSIAVSIAVICFFCLSFISWISGLSPFICCKRAIIGAFITYVVAGFCVKTINAVLTSAMVTSRLNRNLNESRHSGIPHVVSYSKQKDKASDIRE